MTPSEPIDVAAGRVAAFLGHGISGNLVEHRRSRPALSRHLARVMAARLNSECSADPIQRAALALDRGGVVDLALRAGIVWHATTIIAVIDAGERRALSGDIGEDLYALALDARAASVETPRAAISSTPLRAAAELVGSSCVAAWREAQPRDVAVRLALTWPDAAMDMVHRRHAPEIVTWLLARDCAL